MILPYNMSEYVLVCAWCEPKDSVVISKHWEPNLTGEHRVVSHGICEECLDEHFPEETTG